VYGRRTRGESQDVCCPSLHSRSVAITRLHDVLERLGAVNRLPTVRPVVSVVALGLSTSGYRRPLGDATVAPLHKHSLTAMFARPVVMASYGLSSPTERE
jgi:hypothetical protein